jgi:dipeptidase D
MNRVLANISPEKVFDYFEKITQIPHPSFYMEEISSFCVSFAKENKLEYYKDAYNNVIIVKQASLGREILRVVFQAHLDMVAEKRPEVLMIFEGSPEN